MKNWLHSCNTKVELFIYRREIKFGWGVSEMQIVSNQNNWVGEITWKNNCDEELNDIIAR